MKKRISWVLLLISIVFIRTGNAQEGNTTVITAKTGMSTLFTEIFVDFSGTVNEFASQPGGHAGFELSHFFSDVLEIGAGVTYSVLRGKADSPNFSATGYQYFMDEPFNETVQYANRLWGPQLFAKYYIGRNDYALRNQTYIKAGGGVVFHTSELFYRYRPEEEIIFGRNMGRFDYIKLGTGVFVLGAGVNSKLSDVFTLKFAIDFNMVGYDFLDVMHNFDDAGNRRNVIGVFTDLSVGLGINIIKWKEKSGDPSLPFSR